MRKFALGLLLTLSALAVQPAMAAAPQKTWTCHATIALQGTGSSYTLVSWKMTGPLLADREKYCKNAIISGWLNGQIWKYLSPALTEAQQAALCGKSGTFRIDYGFDQQKKEWNFTHAVPAPKCKCEWTCPADRWTESRPTEPWACVKSVPGCKLPEGVKPWVQLGNGYFTGNQGMIHHEIPATKSKCKFE